MPPCGVPGRPLIWKVLAFVISHKKCSFLELSIRRCLPLDHVRKAPPTPFAPPAVRKPPMDRHALAGSPRSTSGCHMPRIAFNREQEEAAARGRPQGGATEEPPRHRLRLGAPTRGSAGTRAARPGTDPGWSQRAGGTVEGGDWDGQLDTRNSRDREEWCMRD
jgi:hypothetical protein